MLKSVCPLGFVSTEINLSSFENTEQNSTKLLSNTLLTFEKYVLIQILSCIFHEIRGFQLLVPSNYLLRPSQEGVTSSLFYNFL